MISVIEKTPETPESRLIEALKQHPTEDLSTKKVAALAKMSSSTASKYLYLLERDGTVSLREQKPYKLWKLAEEKSKKESK